MQQSPKKHYPKISFNQTFESSLNQKQQKFNIDRTLARGIQLNDPSKIVIKEEDGIGGENQQINLESQIQKTLLQYRRKYDQIKTQTIQLQSRLDTFRQEKQRLEKEKYTLDEIVGDGKRTFSECQRQYELSQVLSDQALLKLDARKQMEDRLKKDIIYYKRQLFDDNIELIKRRSRLRSLRDQSLQKNKLNTRCKTLLQSIEKTVGENNLNRSIKIQQHFHTLSQKKEHKRMQTERQQHVHQSMMAALSQKLPEEKQLIGLLYTNLLLRKVLKGKMNRVMDDNRYLQNAFNKIRQETTVKRADEIVERFIHRDIIYGQLISSVSANQKKIQDLKQEKKNLEDYGKKLQEVRYLIQQKFIDKNSKRKKEEIIDKSQIEEVEQKLQKIQKYKGLVYAWATKNYSLLTDSNRDKVRIQFKDSFVLLRQVIKRVLGYLQDTHKSQEASQRVQQQMKSKVDGNITGDAFRRNVRIKTLGDETRYTADIDDRDAQYDNISEFDFLQHTRKAIKRQHYQRMKARGKLV